MLNGLEVPEIVKGFVLSKFWGASVKKKHPVPVPVFVRVEVPVPVPQSPSIPVPQYPSLPVLYSTVQPPAPFAADLGAWGPG